MSGRIPSVTRPCLSLGERKGSEKNWPLARRLIPKSRSIRESESSTRNLFPPISPIRPVDRSEPSAQPVRESRGLGNNLGSTRVMLDLQEVAAPALHIALDRDSVPRSETL